MATNDTEQAVACLSVRDYFAAQALAGVLASYAVPDSGLPPVAFAAERAYAYADAMLAAREKEATDHA